MNLRKKVLLLYLFVVVIPVILLGLAAERIMFNSLKSDYSVSVNEAVDQVVKNVEFRKLTYELLIHRGTVLQNQQNRSILKNCPQTGLLKNNT